MVKNPFLFIFSDPEKVFPLCLNAEILNDLFTLVPIFDKYHMNMGFHGNQTDVYM